MSRQLGAVLGRFPARGLPALAAGCLLISAFTLAVSRPPTLSAAALQTLMATQADGRSRTVLTDWRWTDQVPRGPALTLLPTNGLLDQPDAFWLDYLRVVQGHERWSGILRQWQVDVVMLDAAGQAASAASLIRSDPGWQVDYDAEGVLIAELRGD